LEKNVKTPTPKGLTPKRLSLLAMFMALQVILSKFLMLQLSGSIRLSIDSVPILLAGIWFGPIAGGIVGALGDILGTLLFPTAGTYYPLLTVAFLLIGVVSGLLAHLLKGRPPFLRVVGSVLAAELIGSLLFKSYALSLLYGTTFFTILSLRALPVACVAVADTLLVGVLDRLLGARAVSEDFGSSPASEAAARTSEMTYEETLDYIHHVAWRGSRLGLERTRELLQKIGNPHITMDYIHVAGTNGKGSTAAMLANILSKAGCRTGLYTSPYINRFNERMQIDGVPISDGELADITRCIRPYADAMADHPTEFELITVIALEYFRRHAVDVVLLEVGLGGELDSTNVIDTPELAIITNMGLDHTRELGPTMTDIARAKAGIIKPCGDVLIYGHNPEADAVFEAVCRERGARLNIADFSRISNVVPTLDELTFSFAPYGTITCGLVGSYQAYNAAVAITAVEILRTKGWTIPDEVMIAGIAGVRWPARFEVLHRDPVVIADGGHNPQGVAAAAESLRAHFPGKKITFLLGIMADKDISRMIDILGPIAKEFVTVKPNNPRAIGAEPLSALLHERGYKATACPSVGEGLLAAMERAGTDGVVCAVGSLYMLGDVRSALGVS